ncbi:MAG: hypothetical protein PVG84_16220 [Desulfobacterales bacterium]
MPTPFLEEEFTFTNPDGETIQVRGSGNQHYAVFETLDGYTITKDPETGFYQYAELSADKTISCPQVPMSMKLIRPAWDFGRIFVSAGRQQNKRL